MTSTFADFKERFNVNWTVLFVGWRGIGCFSNLVTLSDVRQYALDKVDAKVSEGPDFVLKLAIVSDSEKDKALFFLSQLVAQEHADIEAAERQWAAFLLEKMLYQLPDDPLSGLLEFTEFWCDLGFPAYSPHPVQGVGNSMSPEEYYTAEQFAKVLDLHRQWLEMEKGGEGQSPISKFGGQHTE